MIGKAVSLSEAIARSDRGLLPKIKGMVKNLNIDHVTEEISGALDKMNEEIVRSSSEGSKPHRPWWQGEKKTPERRREEQRVKGTVSLFSGIGLTIFLYYLTGALVLKLPPDVVAKIPFEIEPLLRVLWTVGLIPTLSGAGHLVASFFIKSTPLRSLEPSSQAEVVLKPMPEVGPRLTSPNVAPSVTEHTTNLLTSSAQKKA